MADEKWLADLKKSIYYYIDRQIAITNNRINNIGMPIPMVSGDIDGVNATFQFSESPKNIYLNGQLMKLGIGYTQNKNIITFFTAPYGGASGGTADVIWATS